MPTFAAYIGELSSTAHRGQVASDALDKQEEIKHNKNIKIFVMVNGHF